jgi:hypothetical protein
LAALVTGDFLSTFFGATFGSFLIDLVYAFFDGAIFVLAFAI